MGLRVTFVRRTGWHHGLTLAVLVAAGMAGAAPAEAPTPGRVPKPVIESGNGEQCVADTEFMRRNHMTVLMHQRDETVLKGVRTKRFSLNNCIECHASKKTNSVVGSDQNFCQSCHSYAAVKIDCFECHASKPKATTAAAGARP
jgi:hypothetical protein